LSVRRRGEAHDLARGLLRFAETLLRQPGKVLLSLRGAMGRGRGQFMRTLSGAIVSGGLGMLFFAGMTLAQEDVIKDTIKDAVADTAPAQSAETDVIDVSEIDRVDECIDAKVCIDRYLWSLYERTRKVDAVRVPEQIKVVVKRKGKIKTVTKTISKFVIEDFAWKDPDAAKRAGKSPLDYVIGGLDPGFKVQLFHALRALEEAGLMPGITSAFRDDYRQAIATGQKAQNDRSFHGGSFRGGYGHGLAADIVSIKGETRADRLASSDVLWKWVDAHEKELGIGRPYLDRDAPHVGPLDGREYFAHRVEPKMRQAEKAEQALKQKAEKTRQADKAHHQTGETHQADTKPKGDQRVALHSDRVAPKRAKAVRPTRAQSRSTHST
jgi:hypothetical protein